MRWYLSRHMTTTAAMLHRDKSGRSLQRRSSIPAFLPGIQTEMSDPSPADFLNALPTELQRSVLYYLRHEGGIKCLFSHRAVSRQWRRIIDEHLYDYFTKGPDTLYCYVNLWNRFRQKLVQQRVILRLRTRCIEYKSKTPSPENHSPIAETDSSSPDLLLDDDSIISWQPPSHSSETPSLSPRKYTAFIYDACFETKYQDERDAISPLDIHPRTRSPIGLGTGLKRLIEKANQPPRSGTIFPLFHIIQEAWDFILGDDAALVPVYPPIASEAWLQIRLATGPVPARFREPPAIYIEPSRDPHWPFRFDEYLRFPSERGDDTAGEHQYAVVSRLALPNLVEDEGLLLVTIRDTTVGEWISDPRYREIMESMINIADVGGPQEFILGGAVVGLRDFARFIPLGMVPWFRRRILEQNDSPDAGTRSRREDSSSEEAQGTAESGDTDEDENEGDESEEEAEEDDVMGRAERALEILR